MFSEIFYTFLVTSVIGCALAVFKMAYKSKCSKFSLCGVSIERDVAQEEKLDELEMQRVVRQNSAEEQKSI